MKLIGRKKECDELNELLRVNRPQFVAVYGRRRVGKTYLIKRFFKDSFSFYVTGVKKMTPRERLSAFGRALGEAGYRSGGAPKNWPDAFARLRELLRSDSVYREPSSGKRIVFIDELPWIAGKRGSFLKALDEFWNKWGESQEDLLLIICGSATSWIIKNIIEDTGGYHDRVTKRMRILPFKIAECKALLDENGVRFSDRELIESYMVFGGIPYYLNLLSPSLSLSQNVQRLCFDESGDLRHEHIELLSSLFSNPSIHSAILKALFGHPDGLVRADLAKIKDIGDGEPLTTALDELEQCGFIRAFPDFKKEKTGMLYQLIDPFILFSYTYLNNRRVSDWMGFVGTPSYYVWGGHAFEALCMNHIREIKRALGIEGVSTNEFSFHNAKGDNPFQIDLLIDRRDDVINLCEMKYSSSEYEMDAEEEKRIRRRLERFRLLTGTRKAVRVTLITPYGLARNKHSGIADNEIAFVGDVMG